MLTDEQLNVVFDHITQNHQIDSLEQVFAAAADRPEAQACQGIAAEARRSPG